MYIYIYIFLYPIRIYPDPPPLRIPGKPVILYWFLYYFLICGMTAAFWFAREAPDIQTLA